MSTDTLTNLYEQDILLWAEATSALLRAKEFHKIDLEHLIEEVESLGVSQKKELLSRLTTLLAHLLKRLYVDSPDDYKGWERTIRNQRLALEVLLTQVPSLKTRWDGAFTEAWRISSQSVQREYPKTSFPVPWQYANTLSAMLQEDFWHSPS